MSEKETKKQEQYTHLYKMESYGLLDSPKNHIKINQLFIFGKVSICLQNVELIESLFGGERNDKFLPKVNNQNFVIIQVKN